MFTFYLEGQELGTVSKKNMEQGFPVKVCEVITTDGDPVNVCLSKRVNSLKNLNFSLTRPSFLCTPTR